MTDDKLTFASQVSKGVSWKVVTMGIGFVGSIYFARILGPQEYGIFALVLMLTTLLSNAITGWASACKKRLSEVDFPSEEAIGSGLAVSLLLSPVIAGGFVVFEQATGTFGVGQYLPIFVVLFVVLSVFETLNVLLTGLPHFSNAMKLDSLRSLLKTTFQFLCILAGLRAFGMLAGVILASVVLLPLMLKELGILPAVPSRESLVETGQFAKYSVFRYLVSGGYARLDAVLIGSLLTSSAFGEYQVAYKLMMPAGLVGTVAGTGLMGRVSHNHSQNESSSEPINRSLWFSSVLAIPILFGAAALPSVLIEVLYGSAYRTPALLVVGVAGFKLLQTQTKQLESVISGIDRPDINLKVLVAVLTIGIVLGYAFVTAYGLVGMALTMIVAEITRYAAMGYVVKHETSGVRLFPRPLVHQVIAGVGMFALVRGFQQAVRVDSIPSLTAAVLVGAGAYFLLLYLLSGQHRSVANSLAAKIAMSLRRQSQ